MYRLTSNIRFSFGSMVSCRPGLYVPLEQLRRRDPQNLVSVDTDITIEGFARSGTSFAYRAFQRVNPEMRVAHHKHAAAQVIESARRGIPTLLVLREPEPTARSLLVRRPDLEPATVIAAWARFHRALVPWRDRFVVGTFEQITGNFGAVIERMNERFGRRFVCFQHNHDQVEAVFRDMDRDNVSAYGRLLHTHVPRPDTERERLKSHLRLDGLTRDLDNARRIYHMLADGGCARAP